MTHAIETTASGPTAATIRLTEWTSCGGCAAKWGASLLRDLVDELSPPAGPGLLVGLAPFDDAAIYQLSEDLALVSTTDFFPPLVDDPADFGAIAAANACSDVYAMGGRVAVALNIAAFPEELPRDVIATIFAAAADVVREAGGSIGGGHTIRNPEPIFGLAVQGLVDPRHVFRKGGARPGDVLLLSKPLGTALTLAGGTAEQKATAIVGMRTLNRHAAEQLVAAGEAVHAVTDVTGYGLAGHAWEMAERSGVRIRIDATGLVAYPGARHAAEAGVRTGGDPRNRAYVEGRFTSSGHAADDALCFDPQTSGGLLAAVTADLADELADRPVGGPGLAWWRVGDVTPAGDEPGVDVVR